MSDPTEQQRIAECGKALAIACVKAMSTGGSVNLPTTVAGCARMSGSYLLRTFDLDLTVAPAGSVMLSNEAGERTPMLVRFCAAMLQTLGTAVASTPPASSGDPSAVLQHDFLETQRTLEPAFAPLQRRFALADESMAKAAAVATGALIHQFAKHMDPTAGFGYAAYGFMEGARTIPLRLDTGLSSRVTDPRP